MYKKFKDTRTSFNYENIELKLTFLTFNLINQQNSDSIFKQI